VVGIVITRSSVDPVTDIDKVPVILATRALWHQLGPSYLAFDSASVRLRAGTTAGEFGRRAQENASGGTDHGAGSVAFVAGPGVRGGLYGRTVDLGALVEGDVPSTLDFRALYASVLQNWLGLKAAPVVGSTAPLTLFRTA